MGKKKNEGRGGEKNGGKDEEASAVLDQGAKKSENTGKSTFIPLIPTKVEKESAGPFFDGEGGKLGGKTCRRTRTLSSRRVASKIPFFQKSGKGTKRW